jgi:hypothetical protein
MLPTERREASHRQSFVQSILSDAALFMGRAKVYFLTQNGFIKCFFFVFNSIFNEIIILFLEV